jgi:hypothetical protein
VCRSRALGTAGWVAPVLAAMWRGLALPFSVFWLYLKDGLRLVWAHEWSYPVLPHVFVHAWVVGHSSDASWVNRVLLAIAALAASLKRPVTCSFHLSASGNCARHAVCATGAAVAWAVLPLHLNEFCARRALGS